LPAKPTADGRTALALTPFESIDRLAALIPPPRVHRHRCNGLLAAGSSWWAPPTAQGEVGAGVATERRGARHAGPPTRGAERRAVPPPCPVPGQAMLPDRVYEAFPFICRRCGAEMRIIAFGTHTASVTRILAHLGKHSRGPPVSHAREPPAWEPGFDPTEPPPAAECEGHRAVSW